MKIINENTFRQFEDGYTAKILDTAAFVDLIRYERERTGRTSMSFSLVYIDFSLLKADLNKRYFNNIFNTIVAATRAIDHVSILQEHKIGILLPYTSLQGAFSVSEKLKNKIQVKHKVTIKNSNFLVSTFPESPDRDDGNFSTKAKPTKKNYGRKPRLIKMEHKNISALSDVIAVHPALIFDLSNLKIKLDWQQTIKRFIDIAGALAGIVILAPLMLIIAGAIKLSSKGTVLYKQERLGYQGKKFIFLKFRSMYAGNDESIHRDFVEKLIQGNHKKINKGSKKSPYYKITNDSRITPLGKILRKSSLDELPQLFNVLMGQMSLVGPRPPIPYETAIYKNWHMKRIFDVKPGITGLWQVKGRSQTTFEEMVRLDLQYAKNWNLWLDFIILCSTFKAVFSGKGAD